MYNSIQVGRRVCLILCLILGLVRGSHAASTDLFSSDWFDELQSGAYTSAVSLASAAPDSALAQLLSMAKAQKLADTPMWRALLHYKPQLAGRYRSQIDADYFFMADRGKSDPQAELDATLAAFFSTVAKAPLRLTPYCRFVARRDWLLSMMPGARQLIPEQQCTEFVRFKEYLQAHTLTLIFPAAHPNSPSSAFGHTLIRIDKKDQTPETRLLNMSINFAAEVPPDVSSMAYALKGLTGGFQGKYRLLPYHIKLREYAQIENRDTWEYELKLSQEQVDLVVRHSYEMLISYYDYYFLSENCSYHLLSLLDVAFAEQPLADEFGLWTIPVDTIKLLEEKNLISEARFAPSTVRTLRARRLALPEPDQLLALKAYQEELPTIDTELNRLPTERQAKLLDLVADYNRYDRVKSDPGASAMSTKERSVLSRRAKLSVVTEEPTVDQPDVAPEKGHETARVALRYLSREASTDLLELEFRPAYHDFRDPSKAYGTTAAIDFFKFVVARDLDTDDDFLRQVRIISIESIEPRGQFFKPISWHTRLDWERPEANSPHRFTFNVGAGAAWQREKNRPVVFGFLESDIVNDSAFESSTFLQLGASGGLHWEPQQGFRLGVEANLRQQIGFDDYRHSVELWGSWAVADNLALVVDTNVEKRKRTDTARSTSAQLRYYF